MPFAVGAQCIADAAAAATAQCAALSGATALGTQACASYNGAAWPSVNYAMTAYSAGAGPVAFVHTQIMQTCQALTVQDGIDLGWKVGACWAAAAAVKFIARAIV